MSATLPAVVVPDEYSEKVAYLRCPATKRIRFNVFNQPVFWRRGFAPPGGQGISWEPEEEQPPIRASFEDECDAIQVRAAIPAAKLASGSRQAMVAISTR